MSIKSLWMTMAAGVVVLGVGTTMALAGAGDDAVKSRQGCMKAHGATLGVIGPMMKGDKPFDKAAMDAAFADEDKACADWGKVWGAEVMKGETLETWAKPEIWSDAAGWEAAGKAWYGASQAVRGAADEGAFKAAFPALAKSCGDCHEKFRRPKG